MARTKQTGGKPQPRRKVLSNGAENSKKKRKVVKKGKGKKENEVVQPNELTLQFMCMPSTRDQTHTVDIDDIIGDTIAKVKNTDEYYKNDILGFYISNKPKDGDVKFSYFGYDYLLHKKWSDYPEFVDSLDFRAILISCASIYHPGPFLQQIKYPLIYYQHTDKDVSWPPGSNWDEGDPIMMTPFFSKVEHSKENHLDNKWNNLIVIEYPNGSRKVVNLWAYYKGVSQTVPLKDPLTNTVLSLEKPAPDDELHTLMTGKTWTDSTLPIVKLKFKGSSGSSNVGSSSSSSNVVDLVSEDEDDELLHPQIIASSSTVTPHVHVWNVGDLVSANGQSRFDLINDTSTGTIIGVRDMNMGDGMRLDITWDVNDRIGRPIRALFRYEEVVPSYDVGDYVACKDSALRGYVTAVMVTTTVCHRVRWIKFVDFNVPGWSDVNHQDTKREDELVYWDGKVWDGTAMTPLNDEEPTITPHVHVWNVGDRVRPYGQTSRYRIDDTSTGTITSLARLNGVENLDITWDETDRIGRPIRTVFTYDEVYPTSFDVGDYVACKGSPLRGYVTDVRCHTGGGNFYHVRWTKYFVAANVVDGTTPRWDDRDQQDTKRGNELVYWDGNVDDDHPEPEEETASIVVDNVDELDEESTTITPHTHKFEVGERVVARTQMGSIARGTVGTVSAVSHIVGRHHVTIKWDGQSTVSLVHCNATAVDPLVFKVGDYVRTRGIKHGFVTAVNQAFMTSVANEDHLVFTQHYSYCFTVEWTHEKRPGSEPIRYTSPRNVTGIERRDLFGWNGHFEDVEPTVTPHL